MTPFEKEKDSSPTRFDGFHPEAIKVPGLTKSSLEIPSLARNLGKRIDVLKYKQGMPCLWVVFLGGTGTGKSTLFNTLCGAALSETGVERPKTSGPIVYAPKGCPVEKDFPLPGMELCKESCEGSGYVLRSSGRFAHSRSYLEGLAKAHGFAIELNRNIGIRKERGEWIMGDIFALRRQ